jgi:hypothetical protein
MNATAQLRSADPAAGLAPDPLGIDGQALFERIVAEAPSPGPRVGRRALGRAAPTRPARRILIGGTVGAALLTAALVAPLPWRDGSGLGSAAYAVTAESGGATRVELRWSELRDPAALQAALDRAGAPVRILTGTTLSPNVLATVRACAQPTSGLPYSARAVTWDLPAGSDFNGIVIHPKAFPAGGTLVIEAFYRPGTHVLESTLSFMAIGKVPTCVAPVYAGTPAAS